MRVIGGELGGRQLYAPPSRETRPTLDRARAGLYDWLGERVRDLRVLDLFAGTGALGIEALSRGARSAVFVERGRAPLAALRRNLGNLRLGPPRARVLPMSVASALARLPRRETFELALADPPYRGTFPEARDARCLLERVEPGGWLVLECSAHDAPDASLASTLGFRVPEVRRYGQTVFRIYERTEAARGESAHE